MGGLLVNDELGRVWKEAIMGYLKYFPGNFLEGLRKITRNLGQYIRYRVRDSNQTLPEYESRGLVLRQSLSVLWIFY
jgi:hypothetical protein